MERRVQANLQAVNQALDPYWERLRGLAVESTYNWYWLVDGLRSQGRDVRLANPAKMAQYEGLKVTDDAHDAGWMAEQLRLGILPESYIYPPEARPLRDVLRRRRSLRCGFIPGSPLGMSARNGAAMCRWP